MNILLASIVSVICLLAIWLATVSLVLLVEKFFNVTQ
jgi:hypothetical protein